MILGLDDKSGRIQTLPTVHSVSRQTACLAHTTLCQITSWKHDLLYKAFNNPLYNYCKKTSEMNRGKVVPYRYRARYQESWSLVRSVMYENQEIGGFHCNVVVPLLLIGSSHVTQPTRPPATFTWSAVQSIPTELQSTHDQP